MPLAIDAYFMDAKAKTKIPMQFHSFGLPSFETWQLLMALLIHLRLCINTHTHIKRYEGFESCIQIITRQNIYISVLAYAPNRPT